MTAFSTPASKRSAEAVRRGQLIEPINPATCEVIASIPVTSADELEAVMARAKSAQPMWAAMTGMERGRILRRAADILRDRNEELALLETRNTGKPIQETLAVDILIVFADAKLDNAVAGAMLANFYSTGQVCSNGTRVFVERSILPAFLEALIVRTRRLKVGDPTDPATQIGPLVSRAQLDLVMGHIARAKHEGVRLVFGGARLTGDLYDKGFYVEPTIFEALSDAPAIVRDEVFGPVMTVLGFDDEAEVIARANDTEFGLAAGLFTQNITRAHRVIAALQAGTCWINQYNVTPIELPFGGMKGSGLGRENSLAAIEHYTQLKSVYVALGDIDCPY